MKDKLSLIPIPLIPTMIGACTLGNVLSGFGFTWIRHITFWIAGIIWILYLFKIILNPDVFKKEYDQVIPASLYAGMTMLLMLLGSYIFDYQPQAGKILWLVAVAIHAVHILVFTCKNVIKGINMETFMPSWFVTYNGIMVSTVVGGVMNEPEICKFIVYYGIAIFTVIWPCMIYRLIKHPIKDATFHTQAILPAPGALCLVSYLNFVPNPSPVIVYYIYIYIFITYLYVFYKMPAFFRYDFVPGYAGLTFPMAISVVATTKMIGYLTSTGSLQLAGYLTQIQGMMIYICCGTVFYVLVQFIIHMKKQWQL